MATESLGIDIGSRTIKSVVFVDGKVAVEEVADATSHPSAVAQAILRRFPGIPVMATGYGRHLLEMEEVASITEIKACARGVRHLCPEASTIIDIGGQDVKIVSLDSRGKVVKFEMNDRCAAGTGKFIEIMAEKLEYSLSEFGPAAMTGTDRLRLNSLCSVFAESEVIGLLNRNQRREDIARAVHGSVVKRIGGMYKRIASPGATVALTGGGALNPALVFLIGRDLGVPVRVPDFPQCVTALGAALLAKEAT